MKIRRSVNVYSAQPLIFGIRHYEVNKGEGGLLLGGFRVSALRRGEGDVENLWTRWTGPARSYVATNQSNP